MIVAVLGLWLVVAIYLYVQSLPELWSDDEPREAERTLAARRAEKQTAEARNA